MEDDRKEIRDLIYLQDQALNQIKSPMDEWIQIDMNTIPFYFEEDNYKFKKKCWIKIDPDIYFEKMLEKMISLEPLFAKISTDFKKKLKSAMFSSFNCINSNEDREIELSSQKYPSWARFWNAFYTGSGLNGLIPWDDVNDQIVFEKVDTLIQDYRKCNEILGFDFTSEYRRLKKLHHDPILDKKYKAHRNSVNKKVS